MSWLSKWVTDEWKNAWKWLQRAACGLLVAAGPICASADAAEYIPHNWFRYGMSALGLLILLIRCARKQ